MKPGRSDHRQSDDSNSEQNRLAEMLGARPGSRSVSGRVVRHLQRRLIAGVLVFLPILVTYWVFSFAYDLIDSLLDPFIRWFNLPYKEGFDVSDVVEVAVIVVIIYITGLLIGWAATKLLINLVHGIIGRIPVIGPVYNTTRFGIDFLSDTQQQNYRGVVLLEFPRLGVLSVGLITSNLGRLNGAEEYLTVYVPTTPVPSSGFLIVVPASLVTPTDITVEEAMRMIISGGILAGDIFDNREVIGKRRLPDDWLWGGYQPDPEVAVPDTEEPPEAPEQD
jgi:uncharacterized membrane protein